MKKSFIFTVCTLLSFLSPSVFADHIEINSIVQKNSQLPPSACINTNASLCYDDKVRDFISFKEDKVEKEPTIFLENGKICFFDLKHGSHYDVLIKKGLKDSEGNVLPHDVKKQFTLVDAAPSIRGERNLILPLYDENPFFKIRSVNLDRLNIEVYKIHFSNLDDISFSRIIHIDRYDLDELKKTDAVFLTNKTLAIDNKQNEEITTKVYLKDLLKDKYSSGIYFINAYNSEHDSSSLSYVMPLIVSDLGVSLYYGENKITTSVRSFKTAKGIADASLSLIAINNEVLETTKTDKNGFATFKGNYNKNKQDPLSPSYVIARYKDDVYALDIKSYDIKFDGTDGIKAGDYYLYTYKDRGIYKPSETVHFTALTRDKNFRARNHGVLTFKFIMPNGIKYKKVEVVEKNLGQYVYDLELPNRGGRGIWTIEIYDSKENLLQKDNFAVSNFHPQQINVTDDSDIDYVTANTTNTVNFQALLNSGIPAETIPYQSYFSIEKSTKYLQQFKDYYFGDNDDSSNYVKNFSGYTDANGYISLTDKIPDISYPSELVVYAHLLDSQNQNVTYSKSFNIYSRDYFLGLKDNSKNDVHSFDIIAVNSSGVPSKQKGHYSLYKIKHIAQSMYINGSWTSRFFEDRTLIKESDFIANYMDKQDEIVFTNLEEGEYELVLKNYKGKTKYKFHKGYSIVRNNVDYNRFDIFSDKEFYKKNENINLSFYSNINGYATIAICKNDVKDIKNVEIVKGINKFSIKADESLYPGFYVMINTYKGIIDNSTPLIRSYGINYIKYDTSSSILNVTSTLGENLSIKSGDKLSFDLNIDTDEEAYATLALVDESILDLTKYNTPKPQSYILDRSLLNINLYDDYAFLINRILEKKQGYGDEINNEINNYNYISNNGTVIFKDDIVFKHGRAHVEIDEDINPGNLRLMVVAWSKDATGSLERNINFYSSELATLNIPRFLNVGDRSVGSITLHNNESMVKTFKIKRKCSREIICSNIDEVLVEGNDSQTIDFNISAKLRGNAKVKFEIESGKYKQVENLDLKVVETYPSTLFTKMFPVPAKLTIKPNISSNFKENSKVYLNLEALPYVNVPTMIARLEEYYPYLNGVMDLSAYANSLMYFNKDQKSKRTVNDILSLLTTMQKDGGIFETDYNAWFDTQYASLYAADTLFKGKEKGYWSNQESLHKLLVSLSYTAFNGYKASGAYAFEILSRVSSIKNVDLIHLYDKTQNDKDVLMLIHLAKALYNIGENERAHNALDRALSALYEWNEIVQGMDESFDLTYISYAQKNNELYNYSSTFCSNITHDTYALIEAMYYCDYFSDINKVFEFAENLNINSNYLSFKTIDSMLSALKARKNYVNNDLRIKELDINNVVIQGDDNDDLYANISTLSYTKTKPNTSSNNIKVKKTFFNEQMIPYTQDFNIKVNQSVYVLIEVEKLKPNNAEIIVNDSLVAGFEFEKIAFNSKLYLQFDNAYNLYELSLKTNEEKLLFKLPASISNKFSVLYKLRATTLGEYNIPSIRSFVADNPYKNGVHSSDIKIFVVP